MLAVELEAVVRRVERGEGVAVPAAEPDVHRWDAWGIPYMTSTEFFDFLILSPCLYYTVGRPLSRDIL